MSAAYKVISAQLAEELRESISGLMRNHSYCSDDSDYVCEFCGRRAKTNIGDIEHSDQCDGVRFLAALEAKNE